MTCDKLFRKTLFFEEEIGNNQSRENYSSNKK